MTMANHSPCRLTSLSNLNWPVRIMLATFMAAAGIGYMTGLLQLVVQHSSTGDSLPTREDVVKIFHGHTGEKKTQIERLIEAPETLPFNGTGSMRKAFFDKSDDWKDAIKQKPEAEVRKEREGEALALLAWLRNGAKKEHYEKDAFPLPETLAQQPITIDFLKVDDQGKPSTPRTVSIKSLITTRCAGCHGSGGEVAKFSLESHEGVVKYNKEATSGAIPLQRLASITHTHMMAFAVLFGCTGLLFTLTRYPAWIRAIFGPWVLFFQVLELGMWWLARLDPFFAECIRICGGLVGVGLAIQLLGGLYDVLGPKVKSDV
ncbi:MAG: hypothetical protein JNJ77_08065 [Planctomycetia bacterium]|nr:hypothetical protein [Planctomycetia bacterium]